MRNRKVKCKVCGEQETYPEVDMVRDMRLSKPRYVHHQCYPAFEEDERMKIQEQEEKDALNEVIKDIHNIRVVQKWHWEYINDIRNGTNRYDTGKLKVKFKEGFPYSVIKKAYELSKNKIKQSRTKVKFEKKENEIKYCWKIVLGNILTADRLLEDEKKLEDKPLFIKHGYSEFKIGEED